ncbi:MAG: PilZ domain-containing protein [Deltaproteobacteria bacterium]
MLRVCPKCQKVYFEMDGEEFHYCPHCGFSLSDRRDRLRIKKEVDFVITLKDGAKIKARLKDYSAFGIRLECNGKTIKMNAVLDVEIDDLNIHRTGKAVWTKKTAKAKAQSGLKFF